MHKACIHSHPTDQPWNVPAGAGVEVLHVLDRGIFSIDQSTCLFVDVDLTAPANVARLRTALPVNAHLRSRVFACDLGSRAQEAQAMMLGATRIVHRPVTGEQVAAIVSAWGEVGSAAAAADAGRPAAGRSDPDGAAGAAALASARALSVLGDLSAVALSEGVPDVAALNAAASAVNAALGSTKLDVWLKLVRTHHEESFRHVLLVTALVGIVGRRLGLSGAELDKLVLASLVHDVGIVRVPPHLLPRAARLTGEDLAAYRQHTVHGAEFLRKSGKFPDALVDAALQHHEFLDGSGYPQGLAGHAISPIAQIVCVCDIFVRRTEPGSFGRAQSREAALAHLRDLAAQGKVSGGIVGHLAAGLEAAG